MNAAVTPRRRLLRTVAVAAASVFAGVCVVALATHDLGGGGNKVDVVAAPAPGAVPTSVPASSTGGVGSTGSTGSPGGGTGGAPGAGASGGGSGGSTPAPSGGGSITPPGGGGGGGGSPQPTTPVATDVAVVSPLLKSFAFGSKVGMPLLCSVAVSAIAANITDPTLSQLAATVAQSCVENGNRGDEALRAMNDELAALAVVNPALTPLITALADVFNAAGSSDVPFATSIFAIGDLLRFFVA